MPLVLCSLAMAARITVDAAGSADYEDIQDALDAASPGDHVIVLAGDYGGMAVTSGAVPVLGLDGPSLTWATTADFAVPARVEGVSFEPGSTSTRFSGGRLRRVGVYASGGSYVLQNNASPLVLEGSVLTGSYYGVLANGGAVDLVNVTVLGQSVYALYAYGSPVQAENVLLAEQAGVVGACSGAAVTLDHGLLDGSALGCASATSLLLGFDPGFAGRTSGTSTWRDDDLSLSLGSAARGVGDCDGVACDVGFTGFAWSDEDLDGMDDAWELAWGLDPEIDDGSLDEDGDGLENLAEYLYGTDPLSQDTDLDGVEDLDELQAGLDPLDPADQAPTAVVYTTGISPVGVPMVLDGSGSWDPTNDPLAYAWAVDSAPFGSALVGPLGTGPSVTFTPDAVGTYQVTLTVDDGTQSGSSTRQVLGTTNGFVDIPGDFHTLEEALPYLSAGATVRLEAGEHPAPTTAFTTPVTLQGQGAGVTVLVGSVNAQASYLRLRDLSVRSDQTAVYGGAGELELRGVTVDAVHTGINAGTGLTLLWDVRLKVGSGYAFYGNGVLLAGQVRADSAYGIQPRSTVWMSGVQSHATSSYALALSTGAGEVSNVTVSGYYGVYVGGERRVRDLVVHDTTYGLNCNSVAGEFVGVLMGPGVSTLSNGCTVMNAVSDTAGFVSGVPEADSLAWGGGHPFETNPDGGRRDLGATGGRSGILVEPDLDDLDVDADGDGLTAVFEWSLGTRDDAADSDGDGVSDRRELTQHMDPTDPFDHLPAVITNRWRVDVDDPLQVLPELGSDPQGDTCSFSWDDGQVGARTVDTSSPGRQAFGWSLTCGNATWSDEAVVLVQETVRVPDDVDDLQAALDAFEEHQVIELAGGAWTAEGSFDGLMLHGEDDAVVEGDLRLSGPSHLSDLLLVGGLAIEQGGLNRVKVFGTLDSGRAHGRNVLVDDGDMRIWEGGTFANVTVDGDLSGPAVGVRSSATRGSLTLPWDAVDTGNLRHVSERSFVYTDADPWLAVLEPWPGSPLWDAGSQLTSNQDLDGSREDIGHAGGPEAWVRDADLDGMADAWEALHGVDDPAADHDNDRLVNEEEWQRNTDPNDADTDDDRLFDDQDPNPLVPDSEGLYLELVVDDRMPRPRQPVVASLAVDDPAGMDWTVTWTLTPPQGSAVTGQGRRDLRFVPDWPGAYLLVADFETEDGFQARLEETVWAREEQLVPAGADLSLAVANAAPGTALLLEGSFIFSGNLDVDRDLLIAQVDGATHGGIEGLIGGPAVRVSDGAHLVLEGVTIRPGEGENALDVRDASVQLRQSRILGGWQALWMERSRVDVVASQVLGMESLMYAYQSEVAFRNSVLGYPPDADWEMYAWYLTESTLVVRDSVIDFRPSPFVSSCGWDCSVSLDHSLVPTERLPQGWALLDAEQVDPEFLLAPWETDRPGAADLRLAGASPLVDAGAPGGEDPDGSPVDIGAFGGRWGDWPDVDNDRDGWTNLEGDCDDLDPDVHPDWSTGECVQESVGCAAGAGPRRSARWALAVVVLLVGARRRRG